MNASPSLPIGRARPRRGFAPLAWLAALVLALLGGSARALAADASEHELKAAFLLNFLRYVEWPQSSFASADAPFVVAVAGKDPFGKALERVFDGKLVGGRAIEIRRAVTPEDVLECHLVFVPHGDEKKAAPLREAAARAPVLFVGESPGFALAFGGIGFYLSDRKVRFEVALDRVVARRLDPSSQLLKLGRVLRDERGTEPSTPR